MAERTINDINKNVEYYHASAWIFVITIILALLIPFVGMLWASTDTTTENRELADPPALLNSDGQPNVGVLSDAGDYFADHFAYRNYLVDADARLYSTLFEASTTDRVIVGKNGWLYYASTLVDYQDRKPLRDRQLYSIAHNLRMLEDWCEDQGANFVFTIAPDKNQLYGENMPTWYPKVDNDDMLRLKNHLDAQDVNYADMFEAIGSSEDTQYFLRDSHWSDRGALLAHDEIASTCGFLTAGIAEQDLFTRDDYIGDLNRMLYPVSAIPETDWYAACVNDGSGVNGTQRSGSYWNYLVGADPNDEVVITEASELDRYSEVASTNGKLLMFRDSFAIGLLPFFACETASAKFDKMIPYDGLQLLDEGYDLVVVERAQRHISYLSEEPFIMPCPSVEINSSIVPLEDVQQSGDHASIDQETKGSLILLSGKLDGIELKQNDNIYVRISSADVTTTAEKDGSDERTYEAFLLSDTDDDNAFAVYLSQEVWGDMDVLVEVLVGNEASAMSIEKLPLSFS